MRLVASDFGQWLPRGEIQRLRSKDVRHGAEPLWCANAPRKLGRQQLAVGYHEGILTTSKRGQRFRPLVLTKA